MKRLKFNAIRSGLAAAIAVSGLLGCQNSTGEADEEAMAPVAASTAVAMTWYQKCDGCILPTFEFNPDNPSQGVMGWVYLYNHPVTPSYPIMQMSNDEYNGRRTYQPPDMGKLVDMDNSYGILYYLTTFNQVVVLNRGPSSWGVLPSPPKGARRIGASINNRIAIVTNEAKPGGYGVQIYQNGVWVDIVGGVIDLDYDSNGDLWAVNESGWVVRRRANQSVWDDMGPADAHRISAGGGKVAVLTNAFGNNGRLVKRWAGGTTWQDIVGQLDHLNVDSQGRIWGSNNKSKSYYAALP